MPNVYVDVGAVLYDIGRQLRGAHEFFVKFQDRILFGKDSYQPEEYPYHWRVFETNDDYFDYYRGYHAFWKLYGIGLADTLGPMQVTTNIALDDAALVKMGVERVNAHLDEAMETLKRTSSYYFKVERGQRRYKSTLAQRQAMSFW